MSALPTPARPHKRPLVLRPDHRPHTTTPPRRAATQPRLQVQPPPPSSSSRLLKGALLMAVAGLSAFGVVKVASVVEKSEGLPLRTIAVAGIAADSPRAAEVKVWAELEEGSPFFGIDTDAVKTRVEQHPFIREATVRRLPPDTIQITVEERVARAVVRSTADGSVEGNTNDGALYLVDDDGEVMKRARPGDALDLPVLALRSVTKNASALLLLRAAEKAGWLPRISEVNELAATGFEVVLDDGARVRVGDTDFDAKFSRLQATDAQLAAHGRRFSFMWLDDARHPERVAVRLRSTTETSLGGG